MTKEQIEANKAKLAECYGKEYIDEDGEKVTVIGLSEDGLAVVIGQFRYYNTPFSRLTEIKEPKIIFIRYAENGSVMSITPDSIIGIGANVEEYIELTPEIKAKLGL